VHNLLPCTLHATLTQQGEWRGGSPAAARVRAPEPGAAGGAMADALGGTAGGAAGEETHCIASAARRPLHTMHLLTPLRLALWLDGPSYAEARLHGHLVVSRPAAAERDDDGTLLRRHDLTLHPNP
jgi:hypothetical protein